MIGREIIQFQLYDELQRIMMHLFIKHMAIQSIIFPSFVPFFCFFKVNSVVMILKPSSFMCTASLSPPYCPVALQKVPLFESWAVCVYDSSSVF